MRLRGDHRSVAPVLGNLLLVAVVLVLGLTVTTLAFTFLDGTGTPTAEATFEKSQTAAGLQIVPTTLGQPVTIQLNGRDVQTLAHGDVGEPILLPTAPGDQVTVVSRDGERSVLLEEAIDDRSEVGDFVAYYTFEDGPGSTVRDRSRNDNDGTLETDGGDGPTWGTDASGSYLQFDGIDDHVYVPDITTETGVEGFTVATKIRITGSTGSVQQFVEHRYGSNEWFLETANTGPPFATSYAVQYPGEVIQSTPTLEVGDTCVLVGTYDAETDEYTLYIDGTPVASDSFDRSVEMGELRLGRDFESTSQYFEGRMYEFRLYYSAFSDSEVATLTQAMAN